MYIVIDKPTKRLKNEHTNQEVVEFSENNVANVKQEIGEQLIEHYDEISEKS